MKSRESALYKIQSSAVGYLGGKNDSRKHKRRTSNKSLIFICARQKHRGVVVNFSRGGAFIKISGIFCLGEMIF